MGVDLVGDTGIASHSVGFKVSPFSIVQNLQCSLRATDSLYVISMDECSGKVSPTNGPRPLRCRDFKRASMISKEN